MKKGRTPIIFKELLYVYCIVKYFKCIVEVSDSIVNPSDVDTPFKLLLNYHFSGHQTLILS